MNTFLPWLSCCAIALGTSQSSFAQSPATPAVPPSIAAQPIPGPAAPASPAETNPSRPASLSLGDDASKPPEYNPSSMVRVDVLMISLPEDKALPLIPKLRDSNQVLAAQEKLIELIGKKEATLEGWPEVTVHNGQRAVSEAITEQRYPTEFILPKRAESEPSKQEGRLVDAPPPQEPGNAAPTFSTFETRNLGATLEADPVISADGSAVSLQLAPQLVRLISYQSFPTGMTKEGAKITVDQPIFTTAKVNTSVSMRNGERRLIYIGKSNDGRNRVDFFILGVNVAPSPSGKR